MSELYDTDQKKFDFLTYWDIINIYSMNIKGLSFNSLKVFSIEKIGALISQPVIESYNKNIDGLTFDTLKEFDVEKIIYITFSTVLQACEAGANFRELSTIYDSDRQKFYALISFHTIDAYQAKIDGLTFDVLKTFNTDKIIDLTSLDMLHEFQAGASFLEVNSLYDSDQAKFNELKSTKMLHAYTADITKAKLLGESIAFSLYVNSTSNESKYIANSLYVNSRSEELKCSKIYMSDEQRPISINGKCYSATYSLQEQQLRPFKSLNDNTEVVKNFNYLALTSADSQAEYNQAEFTKESYSIIKSLSYMLHNWIADIKLLELSIDVMDYIYK